MILLEQSNDTLCEVTHVLPEGETCMVSLKLLVVDEGVGELVPRPANVPQSCRKVIDAGVHRNRHSYVLEAEKSGLLRVEKEAENVGVGVAVGWRVDLEAVLSHVLNVVID